MHWKKLANYNYLGAYSLEGKEDVTLTIKSVTKERVTAPGGSSEDCIMAKFEESKVNDVVVKPMVLNKTNCKTIEKLYGSNIEDWIGKQITVFATTTKFARDVVSCLRVKPEIPKEEIFTCSICNKQIDKKTYMQTTTAYGIALCSKECKEKHLENEKNNKNIEDKGE